LHPFDVLRRETTKHGITSILALLLYIFFEKLKLEVIKKAKEMTNTSKIPPTPKF
jgi:hypothetical protein